MSKNKKNSKPKDKEQKDELQSELDKLPFNIPDDAKEKLEKIKTLLDKFHKKVLEKFEDYVVGIALLPPSKDDKEKEKINVLTLIDDTDSTKMTKDELKDRLQTIIGEMSKTIDKNLNPETVLLSELWQSCYDGKYEILHTIAMSAPVFDKGMLAAIKIAEIHKDMVLKKFEKYIVSYVLAGSLVQGKATTKSDVDVFIVIDDTDVKKMTRAELKDKLRAIIIGMGIDAGKMTGIENKINIQVYILTDFWENIKEANPIIFTFLRDGVPFYDRGIFMPWKQLLQMGRVRPSPEAIDMYMHSGPQIIERIDYKMKEIAMEDLFYALLTPSQAALMLYGVPPPTPKETPEIMREVFVKKAKLLEPEYVKILETSILTRKSLEHGDKKKVTGKELDVLLVDSEKYLKRLDQLFKEIQKLKEEESVLHVYENILTIVRDVLKLEKVEKISEAEIVTLFEEKLVHKGIIPEKFLRMLKEVMTAKKDYEAKKLTKTDIDNIHKNSNELIRFLIEHIQRKRGRELERTKIRVKHGNKFGEIILLDKVAYIIHDIDNEEKDISKADIDEKGSLKNIKESSLEELEKALAKIEIPGRAFIKEPIFEDLKSIFGKDVEIMVTF